MNSTNSDYEIRDKYAKNHHSRDINNQSQSQESGSYPDSSSYNIRDLRKNSRSKSSSNLSRSRSRSSSGERKTRSSSNSSTSSQNKSKTVKSNSHKRMKKGEHTMMRGHYSGDNKNNGCKATNSKNATSNTNSHNINNSPNQKRQMSVEEASLSCKNNINNIDSQGSIIQGESSQAFQENNANNENKNSLKSDITSPETMSDKTVEQHTTTRTEHNDPRQYNPSGSGESNGGTSQQSNYNIKPSEATGTVIDPVLASTIDDINKFYKPDLLYRLTGIDFNEVNTQ